MSLDIDKSFEKSLKNESQVELQPRANTQGEILLGIDAAVSHPRKGSLTVDSCIRTSSKNCPMTGQQPHQSILPTSHSDSMIRFIGENAGYARRDSSDLSSVKNLSDREGIISGTANNDNPRRKRLSFLHLHLPEPPGWTNNIDPNHQHHHTFGAHLPHIHVPTLTFTAPAADGTGRKFSFGIRRHSHTVS